MGDRVQEKIISSSDKFIFLPTNQSTEMFGYNFQFPADNFNIQINKADVALGIVLVLGLPLLLLLGKFGIGFEKPNVDNNNNNNNNKHPYLTNNEILDGAFDIYNNTQNTEYNSVDNGNKGFLSNHFDKVQKVRSNILRHMNSFSQKVTNAFKKIPLINKVPFMKFKNKGQSTSAPPVRKPEGGDFQDPYIRNREEHDIQYSYVEGGHGSRPVLGLGGGIRNYYERDPKIPNNHNFPDFNNDFQNDNSWSRPKNIQTYSNSHVYDTQDYLRDTNMPNYEFQDYHMEYQNDNRRSRYRPPTIKPSNIKITDMNNNKYNNYNYNNNDYDYVYSQEQDFNDLKRLNSDPKNSVTDMQYNSNINSENIASNDDNNDKNNDNDNNNIKSRNDVYDNLHGTEQDSKNSKRIKA